MNRSIRYVHRFLVSCLLAATVVFSAGSAHAAALTWNNGAGNMAWDTTSTNWGGAALWSNATPDSAIFTNTGVGTVSLTEPIAVGALTFSTTGYTIEGNSDSSNTLALRKTGDFAITVGAGVTATMDSTIMTNAAVTLDTIKTGLGTLVLSGATSGLTKQIRLASGTVSVSSMAALGGGTFKTYDGGTANNSTLLYTGSGETTSKSVDLDSNSDNYVFTLDQSGTGLLKFSKFTVHNRRNGYTLVLQGSNAGNGEISSGIGDGKGGMKVTKLGANTWTLSGTNTYTGATTINEGMLVGAVGGSCAASAVTVTPAAGKTGTLGVSIADSTKQWTCKSLAFSASGGSRGLTLDFGTPVTPSTNVAPLKVNGLADFGRPPPVVTVVVGADKLAEGSTYPLMTWGSSSNDPPSFAVLTGGITGVGVLTGEGSTLYLSLPAIGTMLIVR